MLTWVVGLIIYVMLMVPAGTVLLVFLLTPPWSEEGRAFRWLDGAGELLSEPQWWASALIGCGIIAVTQYLFLLPVVWLKPPEGTRPRSLTRSLILGALVAALLTGGLGLGVAELAGSLLIGDFQHDPWADELLGEVWIGPAILVTLLGSWVFWSMVLLVFSRRLWPDTVLGRLVILLLGGTIVELLVVVPIDIMVRRRSDCYCAAGTFWSLCVAAVGLVWLTGPGIVFALTARRRRMARQTHCAGCGQPKGPSPGPVCPECGYAWLTPPGGGKGDRRDSNP